MAIIPQRYKQIVSVVSTEPEVCFRTDKIYDLKK